jgi:hypothetical protein
VPDRAGSHHPHLVAVETHSWGAATYTFAPFTGDEPEPMCPPFADGDDLDAHRELRHEYAAAHSLWAAARYLRQLIPLVQAGVPLWQAYARARKAMDSVFDSLTDTADGQWRATVLRLLDAQAAALTAAQRWDEHAYEIAKVEWSVSTSVMERVDGVRGAARELGIDARDWQVGHPDEYECSWTRDTTPLVEQVTQAIAAQRERVREVARLVGDPASSE